MQTLPKYTVIVNCERDHDIGIVSAIPCMTYEDAMSTAIKMALVYGETVTEDDIETNFIICPGDIVVYLKENNTIESATNDKVPHEEFYDQLAMYQQQIDQHDGTIKLALNELGIANSIKS